MAEATTNAQTPAADANAGNQMPNFTTRYLSALAAILAAGVGIGGFGYMQLKANRAAAARKKARTGDTLNTIDIGVPPTGVKVAGSILDAPTNFVGDMLLPTSELSSSQAVALALGLPIGALSIYALKKVIDDTYKPETSAERYTRYKKQYEDLLASKMNDGPGIKTATINGYISAIEDRINLEFEKNAFSLASVLWPLLFTGSGIVSFKLVLDKLRENSKNKIKSEAAKQVMNRYKMMNAPRLNVVPVANRKDEVKVEDNDSAEVNNIPLLLESKKDNNQPVSSTDDIFNSLDYPKLTAELHQKAAACGTTLPKFAAWFIKQAQTDSNALFTKLADGEVTFEQLKHFLENQSADDPIVQEIIGGLGKSKDFINYGPGSAWNNMPHDDRVKAITGFRAPTELMKGVNAQLAQFRKDNPMTADLGLARLQHDGNNPDFGEHMGNVKFFDSIKDNPWTLGGGLAAGAAGIAMGKPGMGLTLGALIAAAPYLMQLFKPYIAGFMNARYAKAAPQQPQQPQPQQPQPQPQPQQPQPQPQPQPPQPQPGAPGTNPPTPTPTPIPTSTPNLIDAVPVGRNQTNWDRQMDAMKDQSNSAGNRGIPGNSNQNVGTVVASKPAIDSIKPIEEKPVYRVT